MKSDENSDIIFFLFIQDVCEILHQKTTKPEHTHTRGIEGERERERTFNISISSFVGQNFIRFSTWSMSRAEEFKVRMAFWKARVTISIAD